jgi:hypothetical protein
MTVVANGVSAITFFRKRNSRECQGRLMNVLTNVVAFKIGWIASIAGAASGYPLLGPAVILVAIALHLGKANQPSRELILIALTGAIGATWDSVMVAAGWLTYPSGTFLAGFAPYWILAMWMLFATTLNITFRWLQSKPLFASVLGAVFGPLSYYAGSKAGAVLINDVTASMVGLAVAWAILLPGLLTLAKRFDGVTVQIEHSRI